MNRQTKRLLQRQGQLGPDGEPASRRAPAAASATAARRAASPNRASLGRRFVDYLGEVKVELLKVLWPKRPEVVNYSMVVLVTLVLLTLLIFGLDFLFSRGVQYLFKS